MNLIKTILFFCIIFSLVACSSTSNQAPDLTTKTLPPASITTIPHPTQPALDTIPDIAQYGLAGRLVLIQYKPNGNQVVELDLKSGEVRTIFQAPEKSWLPEAVVSPDYQQILLTYAPPPPPGEGQFGYSDLYLLPFDDSAQPEPFLTRKDPQESFFFPAWAPDGESVYFTHLYRQDPNSTIMTYQNDIEKADLNGNREIILEHALWPALSPDGSKLAYLYEDPANFGNDLFLANPDGSNPQPVLPPGANPPVDAHLFTADSEQLVFSMVNFQPAPASSRMDKFLGVEVVSAHNVPSDWYRASTSGGAPQRLTSLNEVNLNGHLSPDGSQMAFIASTGLYVMNVDGSHLIHLTNSVIIGTVNWIP